MLWLDADLRRLGSRLDGTIPHDFRLRLHPWLLPDPDDFRLFLANGILPCGICGCFFPALFPDGELFRFWNLLPILDSRCLPGCPELLFFRLDGI